MVAAPLTSTELLDLCLAEDFLQQGEREVDLLQARRRRDLYWVLGLLGCRGIRVVPSDLEAVWKGRPGRFRPEHREYVWIRGLRRAIDRIERAGEKGLPPVREDLFDLFRLVEGREEESLPASLLRREEPWDAPGGSVHPEPELLDLCLAEFRPERGYGEGGRRYRALHPVHRAAVVCRSVLHLSPFPDLNAWIAILAASQHLLATGYPPFLPQVADRPTLRTIRKARREDAFLEWFADLVLVGYRCLARGAGPTAWD